MNKQNILSGEALGEKLLQAVREMRAGVGQVVYSPVAEARAKTGLSEAEFAALLDISVATLGEWERGTQQPTGAAKTLLRIAQHYPEILRKLAA